MSEEIKYTTEEYSVLGHKVNYKVPVSASDIDRLDPKQPTACRDIAVQNVVYHIMNGDTRDIFLHGHEAIKKGEKDPFTLTEALSDRPAFAGVENEANSWGLDVASLGLKNDGTAIVDFSRYTKPTKNAKGEVRKDTSGDVITTFDESEKSFYDRVLSMAVLLKKFSSEDAARAHFQPSMDYVSSNVVFDITKKEGAARGPVKLPAKYKLVAAKILATGQIDRFNEMFKASTAEQFTATNDMTKPFTGEYENKDGTKSQFNVSDADASNLGWMFKRYWDWKQDQELKATLI
jgi:hypothetical protein